MAINTNLNLNAAGAANNANTIGLDQLLQSIVELNQYQILPGNIAAPVLEIDLGPVDVADGNAGRLSGTNDLLRPNYFNGRHLTADTLKKEQLHWDLRARMPAQAWRPGVAWGLGIQSPKMTGAIDCQASTDVLTENTTEESVVFTTETEIVYSNLHRGSVGTTASPCLATTTRTTHIFLDGIDIGQTTQTDDEVQVPTSFCDSTTPIPNDHESGTLDGLRTVTQKVLREVLADCTVLQVVETTTRIDLPNSNIYFEETTRDEQILGSIATQGPQVPDPNGVQTLLPGLAFDGIGRPISVASAIQFRISELFAQFVKQPLTLTDGGTQFNPCVCYREDPQDDINPGTTLPQGPYLLVVQPRERGEGEAAIYDVDCPDRRKSSCETDCMRGGFGMMLVRYPVDVDSNGSLDTEAIRGTLAAHYFDVWERSLPARWQPGYPTSEPFCAGTGPEPRTGAVPLAMVYVDANNGVRFIDPWIPRRSLEYAGTSWTANLHGAPGEAQMAARSHQFHCQLTQSLEAFGVPKVELSPIQLPNLYQRGFRHIPTWGYLPVDVTPIVVGRNYNNANYLLQRPNLAQWTLMALQAARAWFQGTNVLVLPQIALHDDDMLACADEVRGRDPILLKEAGSYVELLGTLQEAIDDGQTSALMEGLEYLTEYLVTIALAQDPAQGSSVLDPFINRDIEVVRLILPMEGLRRDYPAVGPVKTNPAGLWCGPGLLNPRGFDTDDFSSVPYGFVMYARERMDLDDALLAALALIDTGVVDVIDDGEVVEFPNNGFSNRIVPSTNSPRTKQMLERIRKMRAQRGTKVPTKKAGRSGGTFVMKTKEPAIPATTEKESRTSKKPTAKNTKSDSV